MSARSLPFIVIPIAIMLLAILMNGQGTPDTSAAQPVEFCANPAQQNCIQQGSIGTSYYCSSPAGVMQACKILPSCTTPPYPSPAFCLGNVIQAIGASCAIQFITSGAAGCGVYLPANSWVFIPTGQVASSLTTAGAFFSFSSSGASGFIGMIGVAVGVISLLGLTVFGSGEQGEGLHILFIGGMVMGIWLVITALEGFPGSTELFFSSLNQAIAGAGTFLYVVLTLSVVIGFTGMVSRGA